MNMIEIGILEFLYHHIFLYSLVSVAKNSGANVTIFTTEKIYRLLAPLFKDNVKNYTWVIKGEDEKLSHFLRRVETIASQKIDLLFLNTLQGGVGLHFLFWLFNPRCKTILVAGRAAEWFGDKYRFSLRRYKRYNIEHFMKKRILPKFDAIVVHTQAMKDYALAYHYGKEIFVLPFSIYDSNAVVKTDTEKIEFLVTGSITGYRRDYDGLLNAFEKTWHSAKNIKLTLLGWPNGEYGKKIIDRCRHLRQQGFNIQFYDEYIPEEVFRDETISADVIISPIKLKNYPHGMFTSGLVEAIRHAKPGIYPTDYIVPKELLSSSLFYDRIEELPHLIENKILNNKESLEKLSKNAIINSEKFSLQRVANYFREYLLKKLF